MDFTSDSFIPISQLSMSFYSLLIWVQPQCISFFSILNKVTLICEWEKKGARGLSQKNKNGILLPKLFCPTVLWNYEFRIPNAINRTSDEMRDLMKHKSWRANFNFWVSSDLGINSIRNSKFIVSPKLYIPSTLNTDYQLWHTQLIVCAVKY